MTLTLFDGAFLAAAGGVPWTPAQLTTQLWLDAADASTVTTVTGAVSQWNDKSGNGRNAAQSTSGNRPTYQINAQNSLNAVRFNAASSQFMTAGTSSTWNFLHDGTNSAVFMIARVRGTGDNPNTLHALLDTCDTRTSQVGYSLYYDDTSPLNDSVYAIVTRGVNGASAALIGSNDKITPGSYTLLSNYIDADNATAGNRLLVRINGGSEFGGNTATAAPSTANSLTALQIGRLSGFGFYLTGDICEILLLNTQPGTSDRQRIEGYLANKWGLTANLPSDHPYKSAPPTV